MVDLSTDYGIIYYYPGPRDNLLQLAFDDDDDDLMLNRYNRTISIPNGGPG